MQHINTDSELFRRYVKGSSIIDLNFGDEDR